LKQGYRRRGIDLFPVSQADNAGFGDELFGSFGEHGFEGLEFLGDYGSFYC
jgi:hypothetical protein